MFPSIILGPFHHTNSPREVEFGAGVIRLRKGQCKSHGPDDPDQNFSSSGGEPGLQRVDYSHISVDFSQQRNESERMPLNDRLTMPFDTV